MMFEYVSPQFLPYVWATCEPLLAKAFRFAFHADCIEDYREPLEKGDMQLWVAHIRGDIRGAVVTQVDECSKARVLSVLLIGGDDLPVWVDLMNDKLTLFAQENGCKAIEAVTRPGFSKFVPDFKEDGRIYVKVLA